MNVFPSGATLTSLCHFFFFLISSCWSFFTGNLSTGLGKRLPRYGLEIRGRHDKMKEDLLLTIPYIKVYPVIYLQPLPGECTCLLGTDEQLY